MPAVVPEWEINKEAEGIVEKLIEMYPEKLSHVQPDTIGCAQITNKDKPDEAEDCKMKGIQAPTTLYTNKRYVMIWHKNTWDGYNNAQRAAMLMAKLLRIPDPVDGAVLKEDLKDVKCLVKAFGVDYIESPGLPDFTQEKQVF